MSKTRFHLRTSPGSTIASGFSGKKALTIDRPRGVITLDRTNMPSPKGLGYTGGDLFQLALAGCFTGNLVGEAEKRGISLKHVDVDIETDWGANDACAESISFSVKVEAHASDEEIQDLIKWANMESTITQTVKTGVPITLSSIAATITA